MKSLKRKTESREKREKSQERVKSFTNVKIFLFPTASNNVYSRCFDIMPSFMLQHLSKLHTYIIHVHYVTFGFSCFSFFILNLVLSHSSNLYAQVFFNNII